MTRISKVGRISLWWALATPAYAHALDGETMLRAIAQVESNTTDFSKPFRKVGSRGERGAWQMKEMVWRQYSRASFPVASSDAKMAHKVATEHLVAICAGIADAGLTATPYLVAMKWNSGPTADDYATRVQNVYRALVEAGAK